MKTIINYDDKTFKIEITGDQLEIYNDLTNLLKDLDFYCPDKFKVVKNATCIDEMIDD